MRKETTAIRIKAAAIRIITTIIRIAAVKIDNRAADILRISEVIPRAS